MNTDGVTAAVLSDTPCFADGRSPIAVGLGAASKVHVCRTWRPFGVVDPRTLALYVIVLNLLLMRAGSTALVMASLGVVAMSLVLTTRPKIWVSWTAFVLVWGFCCFLLPLLWRSTVSAFLVFIAFWMF